MNTLIQAIGTQSGVIDIAWHWAIPSGAQEVPFWDSAVPERESELIGQVVNVIEMCTAVTGGHADR